MAADGPIRLALRLLRHEGFRAVRDRILDRRREGAWLRSFPPSAAPPSLPPSGVLKVLGIPPSPRLGGVPLQLLPRFEEEGRRNGAALLHPVSPGGRRLRLSVIRDGGRQAVEWETGDRPLDRALVDRTLECARTLGARIVHLENLAPLPPASACRLLGAGVELVLSLHDFFPFCRRPHLLEQPAQRFCRFSRDLDRCARCLGRGATPEDQARWRANSGELLEGCAAVVFPSAYLAERTAELFALDGGNHHVIPPAIPASPMPPRPNRRHPGPLRLAFLGGARPVKGSRVLADLAHQLARESGSDSFAVTVLGGCDVEEVAHLARRPGIRIRGYYRAGSLPRVLHRHRVDLALLLSPVPESYSIALDECHRAGVPVVAFDRGAVAPRLAGGTGGLLVPPEGGADAVARALLPLVRNPDRVAGISIPKPAGTPAEAAQRYLDLYRSLDAP